MSRYPELPPGNRFDAILQLAAEMRAAQRGRMLTAQIMRAARAEAQRRARMDMLQVTAYSPAADPSLTHRPAKSGVSGAS